MPERSRGVGLPGIGVGVGVVALCCGAPTLVGAFVSGGGVALGDWVLAAVGAVVAAVGLVALWRRRRARPEALAVSPGPPDA